MCYRVEHKIFHSTLSFSFYSCSLNVTFGRMVGHPIVFLSDHMYDDINISSSHNIRPHLNVIHLHATSLPRADTQLEISFGWTVVSTLLFAANRNPGKWDVKSQK